MKDNQATAAQRADFERLANGKAACGFKRSRRGTYVNPAIARDWKWFQLGGISATQPHSPAWRCFHCDECFTTPDAAMEHFGRTERQSPACQIDIAEYRAMEQRMLAYTQEDADIHREMNARLSDHQLALVREEERGYSRGLADAKKHPKELGLMAPLIAPWPDFKGNPIYHGSRLRHPDGTSFVAMRLYGFTQETDAWRAIYDGLEPSGVSRLSLQIGDKGQATIVPEEIQP